MNVVDEVLKDLEEQRKIGVSIDDRVLARVRSNAVEVQEYYDHGMSVEEIADLMISMGPL